MDFPELVEGGEGADPSGTELSVENLSMYSKSYIVLGDILILAHQEEWGNTLFSKSKL